VHICSGKSFICRGCSDQPVSTARTSVDTGDGGHLELVDTVCYRL